MNNLDSSIVTWVNQLACKSQVFDTTLFTITHSHLLKGGVIIAIVWLSWFRRDKKQTVKRLHILATYVGCIAAIAIGRLAAFLLTFRARPMHDAEFYFFFPYGLEAGELGGWSSFPSDHAVLFFALVTGLSFASKRAGICALLYTVVVILFPRLYFGYHYPTDIIAGAVIGAAIAVLSNTVLITRTRFTELVNWTFSKPIFLYSGFIFLSFQIVEMFYSSRAVIRIVCRWFGILPA